MMLCRSAALIPSQLPISARVRPQPMQKPVSGSMTQTLMQGVSISGKSNAFMALIYVSQSPIAMRTRHDYWKCVSILEIKHTIFHFEAREFAQETHAQK
jgi:hypothetical protein